MADTSTKAAWALCYHPAQHWTVAQLVSVGPARFTVRASWGEVFRSHRTRTKLFCERADAVAALEKIEAAWIARSAALLQADADYNHTVAAVLT